MPSIGGIPIRGDREPDYLRALIHGPQGSGKSYLSSTIAQIPDQRVLFVDMVGEQGTKSFQGANWEERIDVIQPTSVTQLDDLYWDLAGASAGEYGAVVLDSLTSVQNSAIRFLLDRDETAVKAITKGEMGMGIRQWGELRDIMSDITTFWYGLASAERDDPMHVIMISQSREDGEDDNTRQTLELSKGSRSFALSTPDFVFYTDVEDDYDTFDEDGEPGRRHILRIMSTKAVTKARIPVSLHGSIPNTLGRQGTPLSLVTIGKALRVGGMG